MARVKGQPTRHPGIEKIETTRFPAGRGYRAGADARAVHGGQPESTFATIAEAKEWNASVEAKVADGSFVGKSQLTVRQAITEWSAGEVGEPNTVAARDAALAPVIAVYGPRRA